MNRKLILLFIALWVITSFSKADDGSRLWLKYDNNGKTTEVKLPRKSPTLTIATNELEKGWQGAPVELKLQKNKNLKPDGYTITLKNGKYILSSPTEVGLLYATYHLIRSQQTGESMTEVTENPAYSMRMLNHWDNLDGSVERGYSGKSLWQWEELPEVVSPRYEEYARANASIGINGVVLNNVNASPEILSTEYLKKVQRLADLFRPYGIQTFLSVNFASPMAIGGLETADPQDIEVQKWWKDKAKEIYTLIPDFGGFLVKANSEGQPGPCDYNRTHAEGANMLADAVKPYKGTVMWRAFVYDPSDADRAKQAYLEFQPLDGEFRDNVIIQIKNGPVDFQPREPYSPLFGALPQTDEMVEFQVTQEYLGHANHLAYLAPMWTEFFEFVPPTSLDAIAGVANIGTDTNWTGHPFGQANWYAYGRLAWNPKLGSDIIADEWLKQTFTTNEAFVTPVKKMMLDSREAVVNYMMPLGLHHLFAWGHHYGPEPWCDIEGARPDWMPSYYHRATTKGIGFDRSHTGSNATAQYPDSLRAVYDNVATCPDELLLWFHHVPWTHTMQSGRTVWDELCYRYSEGVNQARELQKTWDEMQPYVDEDTFLEVQSKLKQQTRDAMWWRDGCLLYFQEFSGLPIPSDLERPIYDLEDMKKFSIDIDNHTNAPHGYKQILDSNIERLHPKYNKLWMEPLVLSAI